MSVESNGIKATFDIANIKIARERDLELTIALTNISDAPIKLNTMLFNYSMIMLKARKADGTPIPPGPPPFPPEDDGVKDRITLQPGQTHNVTYFGYDYFGITLPKGKYQVRFSHKSPQNQFNDWQGTIESPWLNFEIIEEHSLLQGKRVHPLFSAISEMIGFLVYDVQLLEEHINDAISILIDKDDRTRGYEYIRDYSLAKKISVFTELADSFFGAKNLGFPEYLQNRETLLSTMCTQSEKCLKKYWSLFRIHRSQIDSIIQEIAEDCKELQSQIEACLDTIDRETLMLSAFVQKEIRERIYLHEGTV